ncbi:WXG100 family type VII secretion target [Kitasatospora sp. NPDC050543]|uniref:WXG100 family type VII secretion target n=1 Tax=Kitasatospora sp. NPDC050543 TaxID=3364054 RepID=UPI0037A48665
MAGGSTTQRRSELAERVRTIGGAGSKNELISEIRKALAVQAPVGEPATIEAAGQRYIREAANSEDVHGRVTQVAQQGLPDVWTGSTGAKASEVVGAAARAVDQLTTALHQGGRALLVLADALQSAQQLDRSGRPALEHALKILGDKDGWFDDLVEKDAEEAQRKEAQGHANIGVKSLLQAAEEADDAARAAARDLNKLASEARAGKISTHELSDADKLVLADASGPDGPTELNELLSANDLKRSGEFLEKMNEKDRAEFEKLLADSKSPQERAYLMKALAAGHDMDQIRAFQGKIHGKDPQWLREHLTPVRTEDDDNSSGGSNDNGSNKNTDGVWFGPAAWSQTDGTCVATSTVVARAIVDPVYALELTGGASGSDDDPEAFRRRLLDEQHRVHTDGKGGDNWYGMGVDGQKAVAAKEISAHTGAKYDYRNLGKADDKRAVLPGIDKAVAEGKPVPVVVDGHDEKGKPTSHQMMIIGQEGGMLQIYNPWGTTTWVSEDDFVNGRMDKASDNRLPNVSAVQLPE